MCFRSPCGAGKNQLHLTSNGEFFPCQDWRSINDMKICDVDTENLSENILNHKRCSELTSINLNEISPCNKCAWIKFCGTCQREIFIESKGDDEMIGLCKFNTSVFEELAWMINEYKNEIKLYLGL